MGRTVEEQQGVRFRVDGCVVSRIVQRNRRRRSLQHFGNPRETTDRATVGSRGFRVGYVSYGGDVAARRAAPCRDPTGIHIQLGSMCADPAHRAPAVGDACVGVGTVGALGAVLSADRNLRAHVRVRTRGDARQRPDRGLCP